MKKREIFKSLSKGKREDILALSKLMEENEVIEIVKEPEKTLVMMKMMETVSKTPYYLGEVLACESQVKVNDSKGIAVLIGDDFEKVYAAALIDAALNAGLDETYRIKDKLREILAEIEDAEKKEQARTMESKVDFNVMEE